MKILAIECSSPCGSVALLEGGRLLEAREWEQERRGAGRLYAALDEIRREALPGWEAVDVFGVGRGPGNYTGMRAAIATACALALPGGKPVVAVSSGEALARRLLEEMDCTRVVVAGDARRGRWWAGWFRRKAPHGAAQEGDWELIEPEALVARLEAGDRLAGPDASLFEPFFESGSPEGIEVLAGPALPSARDVAELARARIEAGAPPESLSPLYLHPAVAIAPRFPAAPKNGASA